MTNGNKRLIIIVGFESSCSVFLARVVSHVLGKCDRFGAWSGYGWNGAPGDDLVILHRSLPYGRPKKWFEDVEAETAKLADYDTSYIICTRDLSISGLSRELRFGGSQAEYDADNKTARAAFEKIAAMSPPFIFSFETSIALGDMYYRALYDWLGVSSEFSPPAFDANAPYIKRRPIAKLRARLANAVKRILKIK